MASWADDFTVYDAGEPGLSADAHKVSHRCASTPSRPSCKPPMSSPALIPGRRSSDLAPGRNRSWTPCIGARDLIRKTPAGTGYHPPHLFHDQADDLGCRTDAAGGRQDRAGRSCGPLHSRLRRSASLCRREPRRLEDDGARPRHDGAGPDAPHFGPYLWLPATHPDRRRISPPQYRRDQHGRRRCRP